MDYCFILFSYNYIKPVMPEELTESNIPSGLSQKVE